MTRFAAGAVVARGGGEAPDANHLFWCDWEGTDAATSATDESASARTITFAGSAQIDTAQFNEGTSSLYCPGNGSYAEIPHSDDFDFGTGDFTLETDVRFDTIIGSGVVDVIMGMSTSSSDGIRWGHFVGDMDIRIEGTSYSIADWNPSADTWYRVKLVRASGDLMAFVNGVQLGTTQDASGSNIDTTAALRFGDEVYNAGYYLNGWLDRTRISNVARL